jgi:stearoyl-CoA desaturase (delta-9 desaturase)
MQQKQWPNLHEISWPTTLFLIFVPIIGVLGSIFSIYAEGFSWGMLLFASSFAVLTNLSITTGYHRLFSHRSFDAHPLVRWALLIVGTSAWQGSVLKWCTDHRVHHSEVDSHEDPYSIVRGFWYAHMGWMFFKIPDDFKIECPDLQKDPALRFQHRFYIPLAFLTGFIIPCLIGYAFGYPLTGFFMAGALRIGLSQQSTFFVNSLCHTFGRKTYSDQISARDSMIVAFLTHGEGYHNFHHKFQIDYRNGVRWWQWDPTKWVIQLLSHLGLATKLRTVSHIEILKARLQLEATNLKSRGYSHEKLEQLKEKIVSVQVRLKVLREDYYRLKKQWEDQSHDKLEHMRAEIALCKQEFSYLLREWKLLLKSPVVLA